MARQVEGDNLPLPCDFRSQRTPGRGTSAEAVKQDQRKHARRRPAPDFAVKHAGQPFAVRSSNTRLAAETIASSEAATMFLLMPAP